MRVLIVHNNYGGFSGEEAVVEGQAMLLRAHGHEVAFFRRRSAAIGDTFLGRTGAFFSGVYSFSSKGAMRRVLASCKPDVVHVHNVFPLISPSVLGVCRATGVPIVMTVHNYRLVCPNGLHMPKGRNQICERCCGGREYWCAIRNCEDNRFKSIGYALRNYVARRWGFFRNNVTLFSCLTRFQRNRLIAEGYLEETLRVLPNMVLTDPGETVVPKIGCYAGFAGRMSPEKGVDLLLACAGRLPDIPFHLAGGGGPVSHPALRGASNISFLGVLDRNAMSGFYNNSRFLLLCSTWYEGFPMAIIEAMFHAKPIIAPRIGGIPEIVDDGITGLLFEPGSTEALTEKVRYLWCRPELCQRMGQAGREKALREYSPQEHYKRLMVIYREAMRFSAGRRVRC